MDDTDLMRFKQIGLKVSYYRKLANLSLDQLAEEIDRSPGFLAQVEAPNVYVRISLRTLFRIADVCGIAPYKLLEFDDIQPRA